MHRLACVSQTSALAESYNDQTLIGIHPDAARFSSCNGELNAVETTMSPLALVQRATRRQQKLSAARMAHLRNAAYRGVDPS